MTLPRREPGSTYRRAASLDDTLEIDIRAIMAEQDADDKMAGTREDAQKFIDHVLASYRDR
jgi:hypothetical protein